MMKSMVAAISFFLLAACTRSDGSSVFTDAVGTAAYLTIGKAIADPPKPRASAPKVPEIDSRFAAYARTIEYPNIASEVDSGWIDDEHLLVFMDFRPGAVPRCNRVSPGLGGGDCFVAWNIRDNQLDFDVRSGLDGIKTILVIGSGPTARTIPMPQRRIPNVRGQKPMPLSSEHVANPYLVFAGERYKMRDEEALTVVGAVVVASRENDVLATYFLKRGHEWLAIFSAVPAGASVTPSPDGCKIAVPYKRSSKELWRVLVVDLCAAVSERKPA